MCDTLLITNSDAIEDRFESVSNRLHLTRNNVFSMAAFEAAYRHGGPWLDALIDLVVMNSRHLQDRLTGPVKALAQEATYLAWLDLRDLELEVPDVPRWLADAGIALSPGHWFGREGAGFARMSIAVRPEVIEDATVGCSNTLRRGLDDRWSRCRSCPVWLGYRFWGSCRRSSERRPIRTCGYSFPVGEAFPEAVSG